MSRQAILHIGTMKTGSTSIQTFLTKHREAMTRQGAYFPTSPGPKAHSLLTAAAAPAHRVHSTVDSSLWKGIEPAARVAQFRKEFDEEMRTLPKGVDRVIFSDERLSFMLDEQDVVRLAEQFRAYFDRVTVVVFLRRQDYYLASRYAEQLRTGQIRQPDHVHRKSQNLHHYDFRAMMDRWAAGFGETSMLPRIYENTPEARFDSVADFASVCRLDLPPIRKKTNASRPSMNLAGQQILLAIGGRMQKEQDATQVRGPVWTALTQTVTTALPGRGWLPTREEAEAFVGRYEDGNEDIRRRWHPDRASLFSRDFSDFPEQAATMSDAEKFEAACSVIVEALNETVVRETRAARTDAAAAIQSGDHEQARLLLRRRLRKDGGDVGARVQLANVCIAEGNLGEARDLVDAAIKLDPEARGIKRLLNILERKAGTAGEADDETASGPAIERSAAMERRRKNKGAEARE